jgi:NAD(P)-dependent dehydrogenase (short-subunit alcohol dehydrogenase family)
MTDPGGGQAEPDPKSLFGQTALVTGSTRGLGRTIAERLAVRGAKIVVSGREQAAVDESITAIEALGGEAIGFSADLQTPAAAHDLARRALGAVGKIQILVNNAGMSLRGNFWDVNDAEWDEQVTTNFRAPFILAQHVARNMIEHDTRGRIVNVSTIGATKCHTDGCVYDSAKGAVEVMTRNMAYELGPYGISVNCVAPGAIPIKPGTEFDVEARSDYLRNVPIRRFGTSEDVAAAVLFFCSPESGFVTGQALLVDGGHAMHRVVV